MSAKVEAPSEKSYPLLPVLIVLTLIIGVVWAMIAPGFTIPSDFRINHFLIGLLFIYLGFFAFNFAFVLLAVGISWLTGCRRLVATLGNICIARFNFGERLQVNIGLIPISSSVEQRPDHKQDENQTDEYAAIPSPGFMLTSALTMLLLLLIGAILYRGDWLSAITDIPNEMAYFVLDIGEPRWTYILLAAGHHGSWVNFMGLLFIKLSILNFFPIPGSAGGRLVYLFSLIVIPAWTRATASSTKARTFVVSWTIIWVVFCSFPITQLFYEIAVVARSYF